MSERNQNSESVPVHKVFTYEDTLAYDLENFVLLVNDVVNEFNQLKEYAESKYDFNHSYEEALKNQTGCENLNIDNIPFDFNRVTLSKPTGNKNI